jgi:uncharacterized protein YutE (UPF0331/DUF86 family)
MDQVLIEKAQSIERCIAQVRGYYVGHEEEFEADYLRQDAIILNLQRACQQAISLGNRMAKLRRLEIPKEAADVFPLLAGQRLIPRELAGAMAKMVGFRNIAVHEYQEIDLNKVRAIIERHLDELLAFSAAMLRADPTRERSINL